MDADHGQSPFGMTDGYRRFVTFHPNKKQYLIDLSNISATQIGRLIKTGELKSQSVIEYFIRRIKETNPKLNAIVVELFDEALSKAIESDNKIENGDKIGRLQGVPFTIKECLDLRGTPTTFGLLRRTKDFPESTDKYVKLLQKEGAIVLGKSNVSQLLASIESQNPVYGITNNAYSLKHSSGGSSGGEGAIISAGGSPIGLGTDIGGSVRIPAAFNGICAIKPTNQRTIDQARFTEENIDLPIDSVTGILANHPEDLFLFLDIMNSTEQKLKSFESVDFSKLKVGYMISDKLFEPSNSIIRGIIESIEYLKSLGTEVIEFQPPNANEAEELYTKVLSANKLQIFSENLKNDKPIALLRGYFSLVTMPKAIRKIIFLMARVFKQGTLRRVINYFDQNSGESIKQLENRISEYKKKYINSLDNTAIGKLDAVICPVFPTAAVLHNTADKIGLGGTYNIQSNLLGFPAGVATVTCVNKNDLTLRPKSFDLVFRTARKIEKESEGLPVSVQIISRPFNDHIVIALINKLHKNNIRENKGRKGNTR